jgi:hypothetical protein
VEKKFSQMQGPELDKFDFNRRILWKLLQRFKQVVDDIDNESKGAFAF